MKVKKFLDILEKISPLELTESYDMKNGVQIDGPNVEVKKVLTCLDVTPRTVEKAIEESCQMIVSHHHPIISPIKTTLQSEWYERIRTLTTKGGITIYTAHTSYDSVKGGLNDYVGELIGLDNMRPLQFHNDDPTSPHGMGRIGMLSVPMVMEEFAIFVRRQLDAPITKVVGHEGKKVQKVALGTGNGLALIPTVLKSNVDAYVTGDVQYHDMREAFQNELTLIAVEHDDTEKFFARSMGEKLRQFGVDTFEYNEKFYHVL